MVQNIAILGSSGSIGLKSVEIAKYFNLKVTGLCVNSNIEILEEQARYFNPEIVAVFNKEKAKILRKKLKDTNIDILDGIEGICAVASQTSAQMVLNSVVGMVGLLPTICAIKAKKDIALANKETLVAGGELVMALAKKENVKIIPVDSEHSAIFQCIQGYAKNDIKKLILTASGGPFLGFSENQLKNVTKAQALKHPNWQMGAKITIDSATMVNKALEIIEAAWLFGFSPEQIDVLIHRESIIHSMVEFKDSAILAQMGLPDMSLPIQYAFSFPERKEYSNTYLDWNQINKLTFCKPDFKVFKALKLFKAGFKTGGTLPAIMNAANEEAVKLFLEDKIPFLKIIELIEKAAQSVPYRKISCSEDILEDSEKARKFVQSNI